MIALRVTGHLRIVKRKRGNVFYARLRFADGRQSQQLLGPVHTGRGRPPEGSLTQKTAEEKLAELIADAKRGTLAAGAGRAGVDVRRRVRGVAALRRARQADSQRRR